MERYTLLLRSEPDAFRSLSPAEAQAAIGKYKAWSKKIKDSGHYVAGNKLEDGTGRVVRSDGSGKPRITDGPFTETKDVMGGYYIIQAASFDDAVDVCRDCPHLTFGSIEVRQIQPT